MYVVWDRRGANLYAKIRISVRDRGRPRAEVLGYLGPVPAYATQDTIRTIRNKLYRLQRQGVNLGNLNPDEFGPNDLTRISLLDNQIVARLGLVPVVDLPVNLPFFEDGPPLEDQLPDCLRKQIEQIYWLPIARFLFAFLIGANELRDFSAKQIWNASLLAPMDVVDLFSRNWNQIPVNWQGERGGKLVKKLFIATIILLFAHRNSLSDWIKDLISWPERIEINLPASLPEKLVDDLRPYGCIQRLNYVMGEHYEERGVTNHSVRRMRQRNTIWLADFARPAKQVHEEYKRFCIACQGGSKCRKRSMKGKSGRP